MSPLTLSVYRIALPRVHEPIHREALAGHAQLDQGAVPNASASQPGLDCHATRTAMLGCSAPLASGKLRQLAKVAAGTAACWLIVLTLVYQHRYGGR